MGVLQDENTISFGTLSIVAAVVHDLADPDATAMVDIDRAWRIHHGLACEQGGFKPFVECEICYRIRWIVGGAGGREGGCEHSS